jgi:hypothetical protein
MVAAPDETIPRDHLRGVIARAAFPVQAHYSNTDSKYTDDDNEVDNNGSLASSGMHLVHRRVPLDGRSQRARLINLRFLLEEHAVGRVPGIFLTRMHLSQGAQVRYHESTRRAIYHWFLRGEAMYGLDGQHKHQPLAAGRFMDALALSGWDVMAEAERSWDDDRPKRHELEPSADTYWTNEVNEHLESRTSQKKTRAITMRRTAS